ncbi:hypothetical protein BpHYR1_003357 [Brachionus plicatilis]|uniref:Uncharacterized protein n=1 Tax=Brachionus plicatilis TaxID=10195 RepID=A0A3M7R0J3_BRAPC|nr:hypothetical protein BpHYR1_003357 [Brachionus plicatilis]
MVILAIFQDFGAKLNSKLMLKSLLISNKASIVCGSHLDKIRIVLGVFLRLFTRAKVLKDQNMFCKLQQMIHPLYH